MNANFLYYVIKYIQNRCAACFIFFCHPIFTTPKFCNCSSDKSFMAFTVISSSINAASNLIYILLQPNFWSKLVKNSPIEGNL